MQKEFWAYIIKDSFGGYAGQLRLSIGNAADGTKTEWIYSSFKNVDRGHLDKKLALAEIERLKELNEIAQIPGLTWELIYVDIYSIPKVDGEGWYPRFTVDHPIPRGHIGKHKMAAKEIRNKYKVLFKEIEREYRVKQAV